MRTIVRGVGRTLSRRASLAMLATIALGASAVAPAASEARWLGRNLIHSASWTHRPAGWTLMVSPTRWARGWAGNGYLSYRVGAAGWKELYRKYRSRGLNTNLGGMRDQFICHQQIGAFRKTWNLDEWRPDVSYAQTIRDLCNPSPATNPSGRGDNLGLVQPAGARASTLFGSSIDREPATEPWPAAIARHDGMFGPLKVIRVFFPGPPRPWTAPELGHGRPVVVSFKLPPREVLAGRYDAAMRAWFAAAPRNRPVWWVYWHEPEDDISAGRFTAADYRAAFARLDALAERASNRMLRTTQVLMDWTLNPRSGRDWRTYYPGARVIDVQAWDQYHYANATTCAYQSMSSRETRRGAYRLTRAEGNDFGIAEIGSDSCIAQRPAWLRDIGAWSRTRAVFVTYFNSTVGGDFRLSDRESQEAWRSVVTGTTLPPPPVTDTTPPAFLWGPSIAPRAFLARRGAQLRFTLSEAGRVTVDIRRRVTGRTRGRRCVGSSRSRGSRPCVRYPLLARISRAAFQGSNLITIPGRVGGRRLRPDLYRATVAATDRSSNVGRPARVWFRVLGRRVHWSAPPVSS